MPDPVNPGALVALSTPPQRRGDRERPAPRGVQLLGVANRAGTTLGGPGRIPALA